MMGIGIGFVLLGVVLIAIYIFLLVNADRKRMDRAGGMGGPGNPSGTMPTRTNWPTATLHLILVLGGFGFFVVGVVAWVLAR